MGVKQPDSPLRATVRAMARRQIGLASDEIVGAERRSVSRVIQHLLDAGEVFRGAATTRVVRYFGHQADAEAFVDAYKLADHQRRVDHGKRIGALAMERRVHTLAGPLRAPWPDDAEAHYPRDEQGQPLWTHTICPSPGAPTRTNTHGDFY